jgi:hypothetical protein
VSRRGPKILGVVLAGGEGKRLAPLTRDRAKPAVPFGGVYRLVDFALSNLVNSGVLRIVVLTQYKSHSLDRHLAQTWRMSPLLGNYVAPVPAQMRTGKQLVRRDRPMRSSRTSTSSATRTPTTSASSGPTTSTGWTPSRCSTRTSRPGLAVTVAGLRVPIEQAYQFGVIEPGDDGMIRAFHEKPSEAQGLRRRPLAGVRLDGQLPVLGRRPDRRHPARRRRRGLLARHGRQHHHRPWWPAARPPCTTSSETTTCPGAPNVSAATGATSGPSTPTTPPTWT